MTHIRQRVSQRRCNEDDNENDTFRSEYICMIALSHLLITLFITGLIICLTTASPRPHLIRLREGGDERRRAERARTPQ